MEGVGVTVGAPVDVSVGVGVMVKVGLGVAVGLLVGVIVGLGVAVGVGVDVAVGVGVWVGVGVAVGGLTARATRCGAPRMIGQNCHKPKIKTTRTTTLRPICKTGQGFGSR